MTPRGQRKWRWETLVEDVSAHCVRDPETGCLLWQEGTDKDGYPKLSVDGKDWRGNRAVLYAVTRTLGSVAMHSCDRPPCLEVTHLRWGSYADNARDARDKGRSRSNFRGMPGESNPRAKLTIEQRAEIVRDTLKGVSSAELAQKLGMSCSHVQAIRKAEGVAWSPGRPRLKGTNDVPSQTRRSS